MHHISIVAAALGLAASGTLAVPTLHTGLGASHGQGFDDHQDFDKQANLDTQGFGQEDEDHAFSTRSGKGPVEKHYSSGEDESRYRPSSV